MAGFNKFVFKENVCYFKYMPPKTLTYTGDLLEKTCRDCGLTKPVCEFPVQSSQRTHLLKPRCVECHRKYQVDNYHDKATLYREKQKQRAEAKREPARIYIRAYFEANPCVDCGNDDWRVLEFDHVRGVKLFNIGDRMTAPLDVLIAEIEKCDSVCANCHKIRTYQRAGSWKSGAKGDFVGRL